MPSFLERMKVKEALEEKHHAEFARRQAEIEAEAAHHAAEAAYVAASAEGDPYHTSISALYAAGELKKSQPVEFHVPWLPDRNGVRHRVCTGTVVEHDGEGRIAFEGDLYNFPEAFARHALEHAFRSHTFAQEYVPSYEQLLVNGWLHVLYKGLPLLRYRERADVRRRARILGERIVQRCHGSDWRRVERAARPKPDHIFQPERTAAADAAERAAEKAAADELNGKSSRKLVRSKKMTPEELAAAEDVEAAAAAKAAAEAAEVAAVEARARAAEYDYKGRPRDAYFYNRVTKEIREAPLAEQEPVPRGFRHLVPSADAAATLEKAGRTGGAKGKALLTEYAELEARAGADGWQGWNGAESKAWVDAHQRCTPLERMTAHSLTRTRAAETMLAVHKRQGSYIAPATLPFVGLPAGDAALAAPWATAEAGPDSAGLHALYVPAPAVAMPAKSSSSSSPSSPANLGSGTVMGSLASAPSATGSAANVPMAASGGEADVFGGVRGPRHDAEATAKFYAKVRQDAADS